MLFDRPLQQTEEGEHDLPCGGSGAVDDRNVPETLVRGMVIQHDQGLGPAGVGSQLAQAICRARVEDNHGLRGLREISRSDEKVRRKKLKVLRHLERRSEARNDRLSIVTRSNAKGQHRAQGVTIRAHVACESHALGPLYSVGDALKVTHFHPRPIH